MTVQCSCLGLTVALGRKVVSNDFSLARYSVRSRCWNLGCIGFHSLRLVKVNREHLFGNGPTLKREHRCGPLGFYFRLPQIVKIARNAISDPKKADAAQATNIPGRTYRRAEAKYCYFNSSSFISVPRAASQENVAPVPAAPGRAPSHRKHGPRETALTCDTDPHAQSARGDSGRGPRAPASHR